MGRKERSSLREYVVGLDVVQSILSDPVWSKRAKELSCKEELRMLLLEFCSENGEIIKVNEETILLCARETVET